MKFKYFELLMYYLWQNDELQSVIDPLPFLFWQEETSKDVYVVDSFSISWMHFVGSRRVASQGLQALSASSKITPQGTNNFLALIAFVLHS